MQLLAAQSGLCMLPFRARETAARSDSFGQVRFGSGLRRPRRRESLSRGYDYFFFFEVSLPPSWCAAFAKFTNAQILPLNQVDVKSPAVSSDRWALVLRAMSPGNTNHLVTDSV